MVLILVHMELHRKDNILLLLQTFCLNQVLHLPALHILLSLPLGMVSPNLVLLLLVVLLHTVLILSILLSSTTLLLPSLLLLPSMALPLLQCMELPSPW